MTVDSYFLKVIGFPELRRPDGRPIKLKVRKHLALLIYLVIDSKEVHYRDELADLLWPGVPEENSKHSLSMAFSVLRGLFGAGCITGNHVEVRFAAPSIRLDLEQLERGDILGSQETPALEVDEFLRDFHIEDAPAFQHWRDRRNAQLLPMMQAGLLMLTDQARRSGDMPRMLELADRLLAFDPLAEEGVRARMEAYAMQGDRVTALRVFETWKRELSEELGAAPSEILSGLATRLRRGNIQPASAPPSTPQASESRFVGRAAEHEILFEAWESTTQLNTRHILLSGDSGIGKSTLAMRFASSAALEGAAVARVQCFELEQRIPFGMIGALITGLLEQPGVMGTAPEALAEVARVVPKVRERFPHLPEPHRTEGGAARLQFAEGTFALLNAIMEEQAIVLIVDDYPRSDEASLSVLHMLLRRAANQRLMVVLAGRPPEPDEPPQATRIRKGVSYLPLRRVELGPLDEEESDTLVRGLLAASRKEPGSPERRAIVRTAGGNPMALELLTQDWLTHGDAALAILLPAMAEVPGSALEAIGYDRLIERIVPSLSPRTRVALYLAAILGPRLNELDYFRIVDFTPVQTIAALSELVEGRVLRNTGKGLEFINELIRARLYLKIPASARERLHDGVATELLEAVKKGEKIPGLEIAWHCMRARRRDEALPFLLRGAREAITHGAPDEAARALTSALGSLRGRPKAEATLLLAETYQEMGWWKETLECVGGLTAEQKSDPTLGEMAEILKMESESQLDMLPVAQRHSMVDEFVLRTTTYDEPAARARAAFAAASLAGDLRRPDLISHVSEAVERLNIAGLNASDASRVLVARALAHFHARKKERGLNAVVSAANLSETAGLMNSTFVQIWTGWGILELSEGRYAEGMPRLQTAYQAATRLDNAHLMAQAAAMLAICCYRLGKPQDNLKWATACWQRFQNTAPGSYDHAHAAARCALAHLSLGDRSNARIWLRVLNQSRQRSELDWVRQAAMLFEADINWLLGCKDFALSLVDQIRAESHEPGSIGFVGPMARWTAISSIRSGQPVHARELLRKWHDQLELLDALDRAEVLCSLVQVENHLGRNESKVDDLARQALARLPIECSNQLKQLGLRLPY